MHVCETMNSILHYYEFLYTLYWYCNPQKVHEYVLVFLEKAMSVWSLYRLHTHPGEVLLFSCLRYPGSLCFSLLFFCPLVITQFLSTLQPRYLYFALIYFFFFFLPATIEEKNQAQQW